MPNTTYSNIHLEALYTPKICMGSMGCQGEVVPLAWRVVMSI